jgi:hypothetical protein
MFFDRVKRPVAGTVLVTFLALVLHPLSALAQDRPRPPTPLRGAQAETGEDRFSRTLNEIHQILKEVAPHAAMPRGKKEGMQLRAIGPNLKIEVERAKPAPGVDVAAKVSQLRARAKELANLEEHVRAGFEATGKQIRDLDLPAEILARHEETLGLYAARAAEFKALLGAVERAADAGGTPLQAALDDLGAFMAKYPNQRAHTPTDPARLPWGTPKPTTREPYTSPAQFRTSRLFGAPVLVAQAGSLSGISLPSTVLPATPVPADTAPTEDAQITQPIRDLAASLGNNPVRIHNWVRNNIQFLPTYGSIQGSALTLQTKRGNAFDTASLLIALLRAANIPARYVYGTIEVPADRAANWVGGVTEPRAATDLLSQGGVPVVSLTQSGQVRALRLEHVWVEAFVDYLPSRGAVNRTPSTWVPLDASFKQYQFTQGMNLRANVPFDQAAFLNQLQQGSSTNEAEGWVQNVDAALIQQTIATYQGQLSSYITAQNPAATVGDILGNQTIVQDNRPILAGTLPYRMLVAGAKFQEIPDSLRHKVQFDLYASSTAYGLEEPSLTFVRSAPAIAGKKVSVTFDAASPADQAILSDAANNFRPSVPAYLIRLVPNIRIEGAAAATGPVATMGTPQILKVRIATPWYAHDRNYSVTAGDLMVFGVNPAGVTPDVYNTRVAANKLGGDAHPDYIGEMFYQIILGWWAEKYALNDVIAAGNGVVQYQLPSHGIAGAPLKLRFSFGIVRSASYASRVLDAKEDALIAVHRTGDYSLRRQTMQMIGRMGSYLESGIYDQAFLSEKGLSLSAMTALGAANASGLKIYTIDPSNEAMLNRIQTAADDLNDMRNAIAVGRRVIVPERDMTIGNFFGLGYIIEDPDTGEAAYLISGGRNGNNSPATDNAYPLPRIPANGPHTLLLGLAQRSLPGADVLPFVVSGGTILAVAVPAAGALAALIALLILLLILQKLLRDLLDRTSQRHEPELVLRHYTGQRFVPDPFITQRYIRGSPGGTFGPGVYLTEETSFWVPPGPPLRGEPGPLQPGQHRESAGCPVSPGLSGTMGFQGGILTLIDPGSIKHYLELDTVWFDKIPRVNDAWVELRFTRQPIEAEQRVNGKGAIEWVFRRPLLIVAPNLPPLPVLLLEEADSVDHCP